MTTGEFALESTGLRDKSEQLVREFYAAAEPLHREATPDEPRPALEQQLASARNLPADFDGVTVTARDSTGQIIGYAEVGTMDIEGARHLAQVDISVVASRRRAGAGRALLRAAVEAAERSGRTLLLGRTRQNVPAGEAFARHIGAELGQVSTENRLDLRAVSRDQLRAWTADGPRRAPGYHLRFVKGPTPENLLSDVVAALA